MVQGNTPLQSGRAGSTAFPRAEGAREGALPGSWKGAVVRRALPHRSCGLWSSWSQTSVRPEAGGVFPQASLSLLSVYCWRAPGSPSWRLQGSGTTWRCPPTAALWGARWWSPLSLGLEGQMEAVQLSPCSLCFPRTLREMGSGADLGHSPLWSGIVDVPACVMFVCMETGNCTSFLWLL